MALQNPLAVYNAATNAEAQFIRNILLDAGIEAFAVEDMSPAGMFALGVISEIHKPQVWVDKSNVEQARALIANYERQSVIRSQERADAYCYDCGEPVEHGVPSCPACGQSLEWSDEASAVGTLDSLRAVKKPFAWFLLVPFLFAVCLLILGLILMVFTAGFR